MLLCTNLLIGQPVASRLLDVMPRFLPLYEISLRASHEAQHSCGDISKSSGMSSGHKDIPDKQETRMTFVIS